MIPIKDKNILKLWHEFIFDWYSYSIVFLCRYYAVCYPFRAKMRCTYRRALLSNILLWIFASLLACPTAIFYVSFYINDMYINLISMLSKTLNHSSTGKKKRIYEKKTKKKQIHFSLSMFFLIIRILLLKKNKRLISYLFGVSSWCKGFKAMDYGIVINEFDLQSSYYVHFRTNTLRKGMNSLILRAMG